jgi:cyclophilin family peptidyl-prolyl cis-trans isomerase
MGAGIKRAVLASAIALVAVGAVHAQAPTKPAPSPGEIVAAAPATDWIAIAASDLLVMDLPPGQRGPRRVVIQLMPAPFSQGWVGNIRKLAAARWWDGTSINRVQDNYVVQWGDATEKKALPEGLAVGKKADYTHVLTDPETDRWTRQTNSLIAARLAASGEGPRDDAPPYDPYTQYTGFIGGFPVGLTPGVQPAGMRFESWPVHCYAMVGVGRNLSPDTGSGAELYTVIGHAPRHLDRNIALVGRVIEGIEHLSSLPRGTGALGFYEKEEERVPILLVRMGSALTDLPAYEYLSTESASFAKYADARANRRDPFFNVPAGGADICNIPVPVRRRVQ